MSVTSFSASRYGRRWCASGGETETDGSVGRRWTAVAGVASRCLLSSGSVRESAETAAVEHERAHPGVASEAVHPEQDDLVVAGPDLRLDRAVEPGARAGEQDRTVRCGPPAETGEPVHAPGRQPAARFPLTVAEYAHAEPLGAP